MIRCCTYPPQCLLLVFKNVISKLKHLAKPELRSDITASCFLPDALDEKLQVSSRDFCACFDSVTVPVDDAEMIKSFGRTKLFGFLKELSRHLVVALRGCGFTSRQESLPAQLRLFAHIVKVD